MISGFRRDVDENCTPLNCCAASSGSYLPTFRQPIGNYFLYVVPETSVRNYYYSLHDNPDELSSQDRIPQGRGGKWCNVDRQGKIPKYPRDDILFGCYLVEHKSLLYDLTFVSPRCEIDSKRQSYGELKKTYLLIAILLFVTVLVTVLVTVPGCPAVAEPDIRKATRFISAPVRILSISELCGRYVQKSASFLPLHIYIHIYIMCVYIYIYIYIYSLGCATYEFIFIPASIYTLCNIHATYSDPNFVCSTYLLKSFLAHSMGQESLRN